LISTIILRAILAYPVELWAKIKADYETGNYSYEKLAEIYHVSDPAIRLKATEDNWIKGRLKEKIEEKTQHRVINMLSKLGWDEKKRIEKFADILEADKTGSEGIAEPDWNARLKAHDMIFKIAGDYAPTETKLSGGITTESPYDLSQLTDEELITFKTLMDKVKRA
jgi:hypothetical protein